MNVSTLKVVPAKEKIKAAGASSKAGPGGMTSLSTWARGVVGTKLVTFAGVEGPFQQSTEDRGLYVAAVTAGGFAEQVDLVAVQRDDIWDMKVAAVKAWNGGHEASVIATLAEYHDVLVVD